jgi:molecular chaperone DnaK
MTAVAEGAAIFTETIDWTTVNQTTKKEKGSIDLKGALNLKFDYIARTPSIKTILIIKNKDKVSGKFEIQIDSVDGSWTSGKMELRHELKTELHLSKDGENKFKVFLFNEYGENLNIEPNSIIIERTAATIDSIPASHSIGVAVLDKMGGTQILDYIIREGDLLPKKGNTKYRATETLRAGDLSRSININIYEGEIQDPVTDNRLIGTFKVDGNDFDDGIIETGAEIEVSFEMKQDGTLTINNVSIPSIYATFQDKNFYSRAGGQVDYSEAQDQIIYEAEETLDRAMDLADKTNDPDLDKTIRRLEEASSLNPEENDAEKTKEAEEKILQAKKDLDKIRKRNLAIVREAEIEAQEDIFDDLKELATSNELTQFKTLISSAKKVISRDNKEFENYIYHMKGLITSVMWRQPAFVIGAFKYRAQRPFMFHNRNKFNELVLQGENALQRDDIKTLNHIIYELDAIRVSSPTNTETHEIINIMKG